MKRTMALTSAVILVAGMAQAAVITTHQDAHVAETTPAQNFGLDTTVLLINAPAANGRKGYIKFNLGTAPTPVSSGDVTLSFVVDHDNVTGGLNTTGNINVYGINNSANLDGWAETGIIWNNAPAIPAVNTDGFTSDATLLGSIAVDNTMVGSTPGSGGYVLSLSNQALVDFVNADTDGNVTIALDIVIDSGTAGMGFWLASRENASFATPTLEVLAATATDVAFEILEGGTNFAMGWESRNELYYVLDDRESLVSGDWQYKDSILGTGGEVSLTNSMPGPQGFYRLSSEEFVRWKINETNPGSPLDLIAGNQQLGILSGMGPVYDYEGGILSPSVYAIELLSSQSSPSGCVFVCRASYADFSADYSFELNRLDADSMELVIEGTDNVWSFKTGNISGLPEPCKLFYTGEREAEARSSNDNYPGMVYLPSPKLFLYGDWDADYSNARIPQNRVKPKQNFITSSPTPTADAFYAKLTDGTRQPLKERYVFRFSKEPWEAYGPVQNEPSPYGAELAEMVYFDGWLTNFCYGIAAFEFLEEAVPEEVKFYTTIQHWAAWTGWDRTNPDAFRTPDHTTLWPAYGSTSELNQYLALAQARGYAGFRYNYLHIGPDSWSVAEGSVHHALASTGANQWYANLATTKPLVIPQETDVQSNFYPTAAFHDQWGSAGNGSSVVNYDAAAAGAGKLSTVRNDMREACLASKGIHGGPLASESLFSEYLLGQYVDTGDFGIYGANQRHDFSPEYKLRRLHGLTTVHSMGLGFRHFYSDNWTLNKPLGNAKYFGSDVELDSYRTCEVLYGNGGYLYAKAPLRKVHMLTECLTVGLAQRYYAMQPVDYVKYSNGGDFAQFHEIVDQAGSLAELQQWYGQFHIRYANGCHVWINRDPAPLEVRTPDGEWLTLAQNCWLVYTEDGSFVSYTAEFDDPGAAGTKARADFCEDKKLGIKYANPRTLSVFKTVSKPTVWQNGQVDFVLQDPETTIAQMCE